MGYFFVCWGYAPDVFGLLVSSRHTPRYSSASWPFFTAPSGMVIHTPEKNYFRNNLHQVLFLELKDTFGMPICFYFITVTTQVNIHQFRSQKYPGCGTNLPDSGRISLPPEWLNDPHVTASVSALAGNWTDDTECLLSNKLGGLGGTKFITRGEFGGGSSGDDLLGTDPFESLWSAYMGNPTSGLS